jgi:hypothetical protein
MRVTATPNNAAMREASGARRVVSGGFSLSDGTGGAARTGTANLQAIAGIDVLVALQGVEDKAERRRRAVRGGRAALDVLETLKLELLSGTLDQTVLNRLKAMAAELTTGTGDQHLDSVLAEIDLRVQVEIAKLTRR